MCIPYCWTCPLCATFVSECLWGRCSLHLAALRPFAAKPWEHLGAAFSSECRSIQQSGVLQRIVVRMSEHTTCWKGATSSASSFLQRVRQSMYLVCECVWRVTRSPKASISACSGKTSSQGIQTIPAAAALGTANSTMTVLTSTPSEFTLKPHLLAGCGFIPTLCSLTATRRSGRCGGARCL